MNEFTCYFKVRMSKSSLYVNRCMQRAACVQVWIKNGLCDDFQFNTGNNLISVIHEQASKRCLDPRECLLIK